MGICSSCLGLNRHPSQDDTETNPLLSDRVQHYGAAREEDVSQPDEEELRREREDLEHITAEATDNMIDVSHPGTAELSQHFAHANRPHSADDGEVDEGEHTEDDDEEEAAWLQSVQDNAGVVHGVDSSPLVLDMDALRDAADRRTGSKPSRSVGKRLPT